MSSESPVSKPDPVADHDELSRLACPDAAISNCGDLLANSLTGGASEAEPAAIYYTFLVKLLEKAKIMTSHFDRTTIVVSDVLYAVDASTRTGTSRVMLWLGSENESEDSSYRDSESLSNVVSSRDDSESSEDESEEAKDGTSDESSEDNDLFNENSLEDTDTEAFSRPVLDADTEYPQRHIRTARLLTRPFLEALKASLGQYTIDFEAASCLEAYAEDQYLLYRRGSYCR
jgi:hypothetical protein